MPRTSTNTPSREILEAALSGLEAQRERLDHQIEEVRGMLGGHGGRTARPHAAAANHAQPKEKASANKKRTLSPEARKRIAAAQKKRWAAFRKTQQ